MNRSIVVRAASDADVAAISAVCTRSIRAAYGGLASPAYVERVIAHWFAPDRLRRELAPAGHWFGYVVATDVDVVVGVAGTGIVEGTRGELYTLYVDPARQRRGVGRALVSHEIAHAARSGVTRLDVAVLPGNHPAMRFYEACGFSFEGERPIYAPHGKEGGPDVALVYSRAIRR